MINTLRNIVPYSIRTQIRNFLGHPSPSEKQKLRLKSLIGDGIHVQTTTSISERLLLFDEAMTAFQTGNFLEVGSYYGATAIVLAEVLRRKGVAGESMLWCIDTWKNDAMSEGKRDTWAEFSHNLSKYKQYVKAIKGNSSSIHPTWNKGSLDLVFIDGDHTYEGAKADVDKFAPFVRPNGRLILHDHAYYRATVGKVLGELLFTGQWITTAVADNIVSLRKANDELKYPVQSMETK